MSSTSEASISSMSTSTCVCLLGARLIEGHIEFVRHFVDPAERNQCSLGEVYGSRRGTVREIEAIVGAINRFLELRMKG
jgi:hypothetical protein